MRTVPSSSVNEVYDLFIDLDADDEQIDFPILYAISRDGIAKHELDHEGENLQPLFEEIVRTIAAPQGVEEPKDTIHCCSRTHTLHFRPE